MKKINLPKLNIKKKSKKSKKVMSAAEKTVRKRKTLKIVLLVFLVCCIVGLTTAGLFLGYIVKNAPDFNPSELYDAEPSIYYDKDGKEYARLGEKIRSIVTYDQLPETLVDAIIATEDSRFFQHNGFDLPRFLKASFGQALGKDAGGASTLTMQISKNKITLKGSEEETRLSGIKRKFTDIYMAIFKIEKAYTKEEIIEFYVNSNYMGAGTNGVEDASQVYFGKSVTDLNLAEAAMIAGIFNAPNYYDPYIHPDKCEQRRETVLYLMKRHSYITEEEYNIAMQLTVDKIVKPQQEATANLYQDFIDMVTEEVIQKTGNNPYNVSMKVYTTMDRERQEHIANLMNGTYAGYKWENDKVQGAAAVVSATDGSVVAIGGGRNRVQRGVNRALWGDGVVNQYGISRQIGSTAKPLYDYALGIEKLNWSTGQIFVDEPWGYTGGDDIRNWDLQYKGFVTMRTALIDSRNIPALKAFQAVDSKTRLEWISSLGLHPELESGMIHEAHATGGYTGEAPLSMAAAYNAFASKGYYIEPYSFTKIEYNDGSEPFEYKYTMNKVMSEETAWMITNVLISVARGTGFSGYYVNGVNYAAKSGTTNLSKEDLAYWGLPSKAVSDLWAVGYTDKYTIATWYGYDTLKDGHNMFGSGQNYRIFTAVAKGIFNEQSVFPQPSGVVAVETEIGCYEACLPSEFTPADMRMTEYYKKGYEPSTTSDRFAKLDNVTNLKASAKGSKVTLTWDAIKTPHALDIDYLKAYMAGAYKKADWGENAATTRYNENLSRLGTVVYEVYEQIGDKLKLVKSTDKTEITVDASTPNPTFTVKTSYTIFKDNRSDGASIKVTGLSVSDLITATQNTKKATVKPTDTKLENESKIATVEVNGIAADSSKVTYIYTLEKNKQDGDIYKLPVKVLYNNSLVDTFTIDITVKENTSSN